MSELSANERFDALMRLAEYHRLRIDGRRDQRWKLSLAGWGAMLGSIAVVKAPLDTCVVAITLTGIVGLHAVFLAGLIRKDLPDTQARRFYLQSAEVLLGSRTEAKPLPGDERLGYFALARAIVVAQYSAWFQLGVTVAVAILTAATLGKVATGNPAPAAAAVSAQTAFKPPAAPAPK